MIKLTTLTLLILETLCAIQEDLVHLVPGYGDHFQTNVYAGYLNTSSDSRKLHYIFVESVNNVNNSDPVTLWLNGGPGCSSYFGFLQEIGPFFLEEGKNYSKGDLLTENQYSWHNFSNLLFIQSPAGVGFSINSDSSFEYNDINTMNDNFDALRYFFTRFSEYSKNRFWIAGQSYAGKYIPDLAFRIDHHNLSPDLPEDQKINLKGILIGNGVMDFSNDELDKSRVEYLIDHEFIDPEVLGYWSNSCQVDPDSAGCKYFKFKLFQNIDEINVYNVYSYCYYNDSFTSDHHLPTQEDFLMRISFAPAESSKKAFPKANISSCNYFDGIYEYFNAHAEEFHAGSSTKWNGPCSEDIYKKYHVDVTGSMHQYRYLLDRIGDIHIILFNGDWDSVVPYIDTIKNLEKLKLEESKAYSPLFFDEQHIGFSQIYSGVVFTILKGASHMAVQSKRAAGAYIFQSAVNSHNQAILSFE